MSKRFGRLTVSLGSPADPDNPKLNSDDVVREQVSFLAPPSLPKPLMLCDRSLGDHQIMAGRFGGLIPIFLGKQTLYPVLKTLWQVCSFYGGLVLLRFGLLSVWELMILGLLVGSVSALLICRYKFSNQEQILWNLARRAFFLPSAGLLLVGWYLWRWWYLPAFLLKAGLVPFIVSFFLLLDYLEREFHVAMVTVSQREAIINFFHRAAFFVFPLFLSVFFNFFKLL